MPKIIKKILILLIVFLPVQFSTASESIEKLLQKVKESPQSSDNYLKLGRAYQQSDQFYKAEKFLKKSIELDKGNETALIFLGELYYNNKQYHLASIQYKKALDINGCASYYNHYGNALVKNDKIDAALTAYKKAISINPENPLFYYGLGFLYRKAGKKNEYKKISGKLKKMDKDFGKKLKNDTELFLFR